MLIRTQDREGIINLANVGWIDISCRNGETIIYAGIAGNGTTFKLGNYETKEKAIEILDEITNIYKQIEGDNRLTVRNVYQMPND